ncbi:MAG: HEPN domain-containing protein [Methanobacteriota archaeon]
MARSRRPTAGSEEWLRRAGRYLRVAQSLLDDGFADAASFWAQQGAEFALKAPQHRQRGTITKTHDLPRLARLVSAPARIVNLGKLATYAYVAARYPDVGGPRITRRRAESYLDAARRIVRWVRRQMV